MQTICKQFLKYYLEISIYVEFSCLHLGKFKFVFHPFQRYEYLLLHISVYMSIYSFLKENLKNSFLF